MTILAAVILFVFAAYVLAICYCVYNGLVLCFEADFRIGIVALLLLFCGAGFGICIWAYLINRFWQRNLPAELATYLER